MKRLMLNRSLLLAVGLIVGCSLGLNLRALLPTIPVQATATEGHESFAIATGLIDDRVEGLFFLDYLTGNLTCAVISPKTGKFNAFFRYNVAADFGGAAQENPKYLIVTGMANMVRGRSNFEFGRSVVYVAEVTSGRVAAYAIPWKSPLQAAGQQQGGALIPLDMQAFRAPLRD
ncbi:MAG: hypothetical protein JW829_09235, partial [Pirellulales bacterium]|nr:hypothetical protein [Pirellulales bacterium]